ncbi:MAG TPA: hypothetical protein VFA32_19630, partial [Dehalococcoidia bacterium]|nr:hypothetical protein [Dehalococcoidia bacterium]
MNTPERGEACYEEVTRRLKVLAGDSVWVEFGPRHGNSYGRILYYTYTNKGQSIDKMLVGKGWSSGRQWADNTGIFLWLLGRRRGETVTNAFGRTS